MAKTAQKNQSLQVLVLLACDQVSRDPNSGKVTLYGLFDRIYVPAVPAAAMVAVFAKLKGIGRHEVRICAFDPDSKIIQDSSTTVDVTFSPSHQAEITFMTLLPIKTFGTYHIHLLAAKRRLVGTPLEITVMNQIQR